MRHPHFLVNPQATNSRPAGVRWLVCGLLVRGPVGENPFSDEVVGELGQAIFGVRLERTLKALVGFAAVAFPPLDDTQAC